MQIDLTLILTLVMSLIIVIKSADWAVSAISNYARNVGISEYLIGFLIVSIGTSLPELSTAVTASMSGFGSLMIGDVVGANIIDITIVLGIMAIIGRSITLESRIARGTFFLTMFIVTLPLIFGFDGIISRFEGFVLIIAFSLYIIRLWDREGKMGNIQKDVPWRLIYKDMLIFVVSIPILLFGSNLLVATSIELAHVLSVPPVLIGLTIVAIGTTTPELSVEIKSILKGHKDIGFGDIIGSIIVNSTLVLGIAALINPIRFEVNVFVPAAAFMVTSVFIGMLFLKNRHITWQEGIGLLLIYATFLISQGIFI